MSQAYSFKIAVVGALGALSLLLVLPLSVAAAPIEKTDGFVCPVFNSDSAVGENNPNAVQIGGGDYTVVGPNVSVPVHATNDNGAGSPGGDHVAPGDTDYTAIWGS